MTALREYDILEAPALWRETQSTQRREVFVSFGDTSLVIRDKLSAPLSHWSLPAVVRLNPGRMPAIFSTHADAGETLEIDDETMAEAIEKVRLSIDRRRPHPGRLRLAVLGVMVLAIAALAVFWLPGALRRHAVKVVPFETRQQIGHEVLAQMARLTGQPCKGADGLRALETLRARLFDDRRADIVILSGGLVRSLSLPGQVFLLNRVLVEDSEMPEVAAGYLVVEQLRAASADPLDTLLQYAGGRAAFRLLTTGMLSQETLLAYARHVLVSDPPLPDTARLIAMFEARGFSSTPFAYERDISGETSLPLIEADPFAHRPYKRLMNDSEWIGLQAICDS